MQWYYWAIVLGVLVLMYVLLMVRQKRQEKQSRQLLETFKPGDKVITHIGIYGKIKRIYDTTFGKVCVLEIGLQDKIDIELDMRYIAGKDEKVVVPTTPTETKENAEEKKEAKEEVKEETKEEVKNDKVLATPLEEKKTNKKKSK